ASRRLQRRFLLRTVQLEDEGAFLNGTAETDMDLGDAAGSFGKDRNRPEEQRRAGGRRMEIENERDQRDGQHQAGNDAPPELEPDRVERDLPAEALSLREVAVEIIRKDRHQRAQDDFKHGSAPAVPVWERLKSRLLPR